jgi:serine/threonine protein kinase
VFATVRILSDNGPIRVELARWRDRMVVVKRLRGHSPFLLARMQREAAVLRKLEHPNIVPLLGYEADAIIYAYQPGVNLGEALLAGPLQLGRSLKIVQDVLAALAYAHERGVIHLDVKPENVLIRGDHAMLADFGFAKDLGMMAITGDDIMLGTPSYMAPEQFQGERSDPRSDLYATGAVLYHMITGQPPYGRDVIRFLVGDSSVRLEPLPEGAGELADIVYQALERQPERRFRSAGEMQDALAHIYVPA